MGSMLDNVALFKPGVPPRQFNEMMRVFPESHFAHLKAEGFRFYQSTFWLPLDREPENIFEHVVVSLQRCARPTRDVIGAEWWFSVGMTNATPQWILPCHFDRNDLAEKDFDKLRFPQLSSVLFLKRVPYGELVVTDQVLTRRGTQPSQPGDMRFIRPARNLYAVFPGALRHGVIGRMWRPEKPDQLRMTMAVNWWTEKPKAAYMQDSRAAMTALRLEGAASSMPPMPSTVAIRRA